MSLCIRPRLEQSAILAVDSMLTVGSQIQLTSLSLFFEPYSEITTVLCQRLRKHEDRRVTFGVNGTLCNPPPHPPLQNYSLNYFTCIYQYVSASYSVRSFGTDH